MRIQEFDYSVDLLKAILWQYNNAKSLQSLLNQKSNWYVHNQSEFWQNWYTDVFNMLTANDFGLAVWAIILGLPLYTGGTDPDGKPIWGFGPFNKNYENGNFTVVSGGGGAGNNLTLEEKRICLRLKFFKTYCRGAIPEANRILKDIFKSLGSVYILDGLNMSMRVVFGFIPDARLLHTIIGLDLMPRPSAVLLDYIVLGQPVWGFGEFNQNFENGNFIQELE